MSSHNGRSVVNANLLWAGVVATLIGGPAAKASYDFVTLNDPNLTGFTLAAGIDDAGEVVGSYRDSAGNNHGFSLSGVGGTFTTLDVQGATSTSATGVSIVNDEVEIVGVYNDASGGSRGFVLTPPARCQSFDAPGHAGKTAGTRINSLGQLVGNFVDSTLTTHGFSANGVGGPPFAPIDPTLIVAGNLGGNDAGRVVGFYIDGQRNHSWLRHDRHDHDDA
jgi:hypothetical protein